jgi:hypothetical protein
MTTKAKLVNGDIFKDTFEGKIDVLIYQANCFHDMYNGFGKGVRKCFGQAFEADQMTPFGDSTKLGKYSYAKVFFPKLNHELIVVNMYSQFKNGVVTDVAGNKLPSTNLEALELALTRIFNRIRKYHPNVTVGIPKIGSQYSGDSWKTIKQIIIRCSEGVNTRIYKGA